MPTKTPIPVDRFGKDHWSLLAYVETRCVDHRQPGTKLGVLDPRHMRTSATVHSHLGLGGRTSLGGTYSCESPTRIKHTRERQAEYNAAQDALASISDEAQRQQEQKRI